MAYDLLIKNGTVIDGSGAPGRHADVALAAGKIAEIGKITDGADKVIDADGRIVAPGFVDPHTHYDAQICWDGAVTPSSWHGVTSVVMGNCGVGIAPCREETREIAMRDLVNVEAIPFEVLNKGITWEWETFPEFIDAAAQRRPAVNLGFLAPLTPFRHYVMGEASLEREATLEETADIKTLMAAAIDAGALGFSSTILNQHMGFGGRPLACRRAGRHELQACANVLKERGKGTIEIALTRKISVLDDEEYDLLDFLLSESGRPVTFLVVFDRDDIPNAAPDTLRKAEPLLRRGARPQTLAKPLTRELNMRNPFAFSAFPSWNRLFVDQSKEAQAAAYADPAFRNAFREELKNPINFANWERITVHEVSAPSLQPLEGETIADIARQRGKDNVDAFLDLVLEDDLGIEFTMATFNSRVDKMSEILNHPSVVMGLGDGGAHVDMLCDSGYPTYVLGTWVREHQVMPLESAVQRLTSVPAELFGITDRGRLQTGFAADVAIFDADTVGSARRGERRYDFPGGTKRMVMPSHGVDYTIVNGEITYANGALTGAAAGEVLRS